MMADAMASAENVAAGARAVFFSIAYPDPQEGFAAADAASVFEQLEALFHAARAIADPQWLGATAERGNGAIALPDPRPAQEPRVRRIHMDWRHIEVATELPWDFIVGGGLVGLVTMTAGVAGAPPTIQVAISQLAVEQADWAQRRTDAERAVIERVTEAVLERSRLRPSSSRIYLGEEDEFEGWIA
jgi:phenylpyruvate tautomerase PptA (4-oxalocrotonate tautomerase family)